MGQQRRYFVGLDLAQAGEYTSLAVLERPVVGRRDPPQGRRPAYAVRHLRRFALGTHYAAVAAAVRELMDTPPLCGSLLVIDQTGVGAAVVGLLADGWRWGSRFPYWRVMVTAGHESAVGTGGDLQVPRKELVGVLQVLLQTRRLQVATALPDAAALAKELEGFRLKQPAPKADAFEAWRQGTHDDLVLAVAVAAWAAERFKPIEYALPIVLDNPHGWRWPFRR